MREVLAANAVPQTEIAAIAGEDAEYLGERLAAVFDEDAKHRRRKELQKEVEIENRRLAELQKAKAIKQNKDGRFNEVNDGFWSKFGTGTR